MNDPEPWQPPPPDRRSDDALLILLDRAITQGLVILTLDRRKLSSADFPLSLESESNIWVYPLLVLIGIVAYYTGLYGGLAAFIAAFFLFQRVARPWIARRIETRIRARALKEIEIWRKLWRFGGVILTRADTGQTVQGPDGHWTVLIRTLDQNAGDQNARAPV